MHYNRITDASRALHFAPTPHKSTTVEFAAARASLEVSAHTQRPTSLLTGAGWSVDTLAHFSESSALAEAPGHVLKLDNGLRRVRRTGPGVCVGAGVVDWALLWSFMCGFATALRPRPRRGRLVCNTRGGW